MQEDIKFLTKHKLTLEITEEMLHDQVVAAIEGGANYWATINVGKHEPGYANYFTARFYEEETGKSYKLSIPKLLEGLSILMLKYPHHFCDIICERGDATTGDVLVLYPW